VGHAGTLDPMATGLLVIGVGPCTRLLKFAQAGLKRYEGTVRLGVATDSLDADGTVTDEAAVPALTPEDLDRAARAFTGVLSQIPPMVSALKVGGQRLHDLARRGLEVERAPREVTITSLVVTREDESTLSFDVTCSPGTYVRVLMSDLAAHLETLGHLTSLRRGASGRFLVNEALTLERLDDEIAQGRSPLRPASEFVADLASVTLDADDVRRLRHGQTVTLDASLEGDEVAALDEAAALVAVLRRRGTQGQPEIVLAEEPKAQG
jgi:tRNA pseudouridine55 synthase